MSATMRLAGRPGARPSVTAFGRTYQLTPGAVFDAPIGDAALLAANGAAILGGGAALGAGPTSSRPIGDAMAPGGVYFDETLGIPVFALPPVPGSYTMALWIDASGDPV